MFKKYIIAILFTLSIQMSGCVMDSNEQTITQIPTYKNVTIQMYGTKEWSAIVVTDSMKSIIKENYDTSSFNLGELKSGTNFTMKTGVGRCEYFKQPDSIKVFIGNDTITTYFPEGLEKVYTVK